MGRRWKKGKKGGKKGDAGGASKPHANSNSWSSQGHATTKDWIKDIVEQGHAQFEAFYACQGLHGYHWNEGVLEPVASLEDWQTERHAWRESMGRVLPASFRINRDLLPEIQRELRAELQQILKDAQTYELQGEEAPLKTNDGTGQVAMSALTFLPNDAIAYQFNVDRQTIRKHASLKPLHEWLKRTTDAGQITRQETVSMLPPAILQPQSMDRILDMCAAPGSKTSQLLEALTGPEAFIVANDANPERAALLTHQLKRVMGSHPVCLVTAASAQEWPTRLKEKGSGRPVRFTKVLADVPCTGDGTSRKNIDVWRKWTPRGALALHALQLQIAQRGWHLLADDDASLDHVNTLCYSTCSQSPMENESVVAALLRAHPDMELVPVELPGFRTRPGMTTWKVFDGSNGRRATARAAKAKEESEAKGEVVEAVKVETPTVDRFRPESMDDESLMKFAKEAGLVHYPDFASVPTDARMRIRTTCFAPTAQEVADFHLERCVRVLPQDNDTGGFFVALLRRKASAQQASKKRTRDQASEEEADDDTTSAKEDTPEDSAPVNDADLAGLDADNQIVVKNTKIKGAEAFVALSDDLWKPLVEYYGLADCPDFRSDCFMSRNGSESKVIHYVAPAVKDLLDTGIQEKIYVISGSIKAFTRNSMQQECTGTHRVSQEALPFVAPLMTKRKIKVNRADFEMCLARVAVKLEDFSEAFSSVVSPLDVGSVVVILQDEALPDDHEMIAVVIWRCRAETIKLLVTVADMDAVQRRIIYYLGPSPEKPAAASPPVANATDDADKEVQMEEN
jgi:16S rRNA C967 or C1407 C5-methylase (RsmB/RsmF family)